MANKDYSEDFFYEYTPKHLKEELDPERDLSSYSKQSLKSEREPAKKSASPRKTTAKRSTSSTVKKTNNYVQASGKFAKGVINKYGEICMLGLGTIIKVIAFIVGFGVILASLALGIMLFSSKTGLSAISLLVIIGGTVLAAILFFPIYGIGHIICQNNEILRIFTGEVNGDN